MRNVYLLLALTTIAVLGLVSLPERVEAQSYSSCRSRTYYSYPSYSYSYSSYTPSYTYYPPEKTYKEEVRIKEVVIPSFLQIPLYGAYYTPPVQVPSVQAATTPYAPNSASGVSAASMAPASSGTAAMPAKAPCADVTARVDVMEGKLNLILKALEDTRTVPPAKAPKIPSKDPPRKERSPPPPMPPAGDKTPTAALEDDVERAALAGANLSCAACHDAKTANTKGAKGKLLGGGFILTRDGGFSKDLSEKDWLKIIGHLNIKKMPPQTDQDDKPVRDLSEREFGAFSILALRKGGG